MNLLDTIAKITDMFHKENADFALIGGLALQAQGVTRATTDVDALILIQDKEKVRSLMAKAGFEVFFESGEVMTFIDTESKSNRVDFLLAHRHYATTMLKRAEPKRSRHGGYSIPDSGPRDEPGLDTASRLFQPF